MKRVTVFRDALLKKLMENRDAHRALFLVAQRGYRHEVTRALEKAFEEARAGTAYRTYIPLVEPLDHSNDYNVVIAMLEMSVDTQIEIEQREFQHYVLDKWDWADQARFVNTTYAHGGRLGPGDAMGQLAR